jgi:C1A family cysteine protease
MKIQRKHRTLTGISSLLLVVMLSSHLFTGLLPTVMAQSASQESTLQPPSSLVNDPTNTVEETQQPGDPSLTPEPLDPQPTESPVVTPEETPTGETPVGPEPVQTLEPTQAVTLEPTPEEEKVEERDPSLLTWSLQMDLPVPSDQVQSMGGTDQAGVRLLSTLDSRVTDEDIEIEMIGTASSEAGTTYRVELDGSSTPQEFRYLLFASLGTDFDLLGGPIELVVSGTVTSGQAVNLFLETRPATGYTWTVTGYDPALIAIQSQPETESKANTPGASALESLSFLALADGETSFRLAYQRSFDTGESVTRRLAIQSLQMPTDLDLSSPLPALDSPPPALPGPDESLQALQTAPMVAALPSSFDWRSQGKVPAVRDQGSCGSCWAFGTAGVMETALRVQNNISVDISEQYLISCNNNGWGCGGGWWAHDLHTNTSGKYNNPPGAVLEGEFPYSNSNGTCSKVYNHPYRLAEWRYVSGINVPSVDAIKAAIYSYGPVAVSVCSIGWGNYTGGVYSTNNTSCSGGVDHAVILVGWNDADKPGSCVTPGAPAGEKMATCAFDGELPTLVMAPPMSLPTTVPQLLPPPPPRPGMTILANAVGPSNPGGKITFKETINVAGATRVPAIPRFRSVAERSPVRARSGIASRLSIRAHSPSPLLTALMIQSWECSPAVRGALTRVKWNDNANSDVKTSRISFAAAANTTYYINVASKKGPGKNLTFSLTFTPPKAPNNAVAYAIKIPYTTTGANYAEIRDIWSATTVSTDPKFPLSTGATAGFRTVWYTIRPTRSGTLKVNTQGSNFDTLLGVFKVTKRLAWDDNAGGNGTSSLSIRLTAGVTYRIMVSSKVKSKESRMQLNVMYLPDTPVTSGTYDNSDSAPAFVGNWNQIQNTGAVGNTIHQTTETQWVANLTFAGTGVDFLYTRQPGGGKVNIYIDGKLITTISQAASTTQYQRKWSSATLKNGVHNIVIISTTSGPTNVDAFIVRP